MDRICCLKDCNRKLYARGFCEKHYQRLKKHGSPLDNARTHAPLEDRFWRRVNKSGDCWLWTGGKTNKGYGRLQIGGKGSAFVGAHRYSFELATGERPEVVMHICDTPSCVNPAHLRAGTYKENTADMHAKGRYKGRGPTAAGTASLKFTPDDIRAIRLRQGESANAVARDYGVNHSSILAIWRGITWKHIT